MPDATQAAAIAKLLDRFEPALREQCEGWDPADTCQRFLRARNGDEQAAATMLEETLAWRATFVEGGVSTLLDFHLEEEEAVREGFPQCFHKVDRLGRPVQYFIVGMSDPEKLARATTLERLLRWNVSRAEQTIRVKYPRCSAAAGADVSTSLCIIDLEGTGLSHFTTDVRNYLKLYFELLGNNFPGNLGKVYIINCPMVFTGVWSVVRLFLPAADRERIQLFGGPSLWGEGSYEAILADEIEPANLPTRYGGTDTTFSPYRDVGPWDSVPTGEGSPSSVLSPTAKGAAAPEAAPLRGAKVPSPPAVLPPPSLPLEVI